MHFGNKNWVKNRHERKNGVKKMYFVYYTRIISKVNFLSAIV